ncbi:MAG: Crp/Fnr family transcriptional regulator [Pseudomonadota bacterium]
MSPDDALQQDAIGKALAGRDPTEMLPFAGLSKAEARRILDQATLRQISSNGVCFHEGDDARNFYVLLDGVLRVVRTTKDGEQVVVLHICPGQLFGIAKAFAKDTYHASAKAASPSLALAWPSELWDEYLRDYPGFHDATCRAVGTRVEEMQDKIVEMATLQVEQRIAHAILRLLQKTGLEREDGVEIGFPITRQDISEMTGTTLHSVSRYLSKWQKSGIIEGSRRRILVRRPEDLPV